MEGRMGRVMGRAGVAITITSITDFVAFGVGALTVLPTLRSFCLYAALGILTIFLFQVLMAINKTLSVTLTRP